jgi:hypothetical protein
VHCREQGPLDTRHWPSRKRKGHYRQLTQVCRQIRREFRPLYLDSNQIRLHCAHEVGHYLNTFYADVAVLNENRGDIIIPLGTWPDETGVLTSVDRRSALNFDIGPTLRFAAASPKLRFQFTRKPSMRQFFDRTVAQLNALLVCIRSESDPTWRNMIHGAILDMELYVALSYSRINFVMTKSDAVKYKDQIAAWWALGPNPLAGSDQLKVSYGLRYSDVVGSNEQYDRKWFYRGAGEWGNRTRSRGCYVYHSSPMR